MLDLNFGTFNPEFWAREYYENLTNKIDIFIETEIDNELQKSETADVKKIDYYNELRNEFLNEIQNVEAENLKQIKLDMNEIQHKLDAAAKMNSQQILNQCIGEIKVNIVFKKFCFLIKNIEKNHVCLISTDFYVTDDEIEYLK
jgi:hypothetical protein